MSGKKYCITGETKEVDGHTLYRIVALKKIPRLGVKANELGGWIERPENLSQDGDAWVSKQACVYGGARVCDNAHVAGQAKVYGNALIHGDALIFGHATVYDDASVCGTAQVWGFAKIHDNAHVCGRIEIGGEVELGGNMQVCDRYVK